MGFKFRKSIKVAPGVRLNVGKRGVSTTIGGRGLRVNSSPRGLSVGTSIPGTGISYNQNLSSRKKRPQRTNYERIQQQQLKEDNIEKARQEVAKYEAHVDMLTSVHEEVNDPINWREVSTSLPPFDLGQDGPHVKVAKDRVESYKPTLRDRLFNRIEARKKVLLEAVKEAEISDTKLYNEWVEKVERSIKIINGNRNSWTEVINQVNPFEDIEELGSEVQYVFSPTEPNVTVTLNIENQKVVPTKVFSLTKTGKLSQRNMAKGKYFQLYQDYVCSCTIRVAREFFTILPIDTTTIHVYDEVQTDVGSEYGCILSVKINRHEIEDIIFNNIDCSDTIETFTHNMKFLKTKGFKFVEEVR